MSNPIPRTLTSRRNAAKAARKSLRRYSGLLDIEPSERATAEQIHVARIDALLWAQAVIERALHDETYGRLGDASSTPGRIRRRALAAPPEPTSLPQRVDDGNAQGGGS